MGGGVIGEDKKCFNGPKSWQLGWYDDHNVAHDFGSVSSWSGRLLGVVDYDKDTESSFFTILKLTSDNNEEDYYVTFNRKKDFNLDSNEGGDMVLVTKRAKLPLTSNADSWLMKEMDSSASNEYVIENFIDSAPLTITVDAINLTSDPGYADVSVLAGTRGKRILFSTSFFCLFTKDVSIHSILAVTSLRSHNLLRKVLFFIRFTPKSCYS